MYLCVQNSVMNPWEDMIALDDAQVEVAAEESSTVSSLKVTIKRDHESYEDIDDEFVEAINKNIYVDKQQKSKQQQSITGLHLQTHIFRPNKHTTKHISHNVFVVFCSEVARE